MKAGIRLAQYFLFGIFLWSCEEKLDRRDVDFQLDFQPLALGYFWEYQVEETLYFGENDAENNSYFIRDRVRGSFVNEANEIVYILERKKSSDQKNWAIVKDFTLFFRNQTLIRSIDNQPIVALVFPPKNGLTWNGKVYQAGKDDEFEIEFLQENVLKVKQEEFTDQVTYLDKRYEIFEKGVGMIEKYDEVISYCTRTDCLGKQLIDSGSKVVLTLLSHGKN